MGDVSGTWPPPPPQRPETPAPWTPEPPPEIPPPWTPEPPPERPWSPRPQPPAPVPLVPIPEDPRRGAKLLFDALLQRRIVLLSGVLSDELATAVAAQIMTLDAEDGAPVQLHITSPDGELGAALMLADTVSLTAAPVTAVCRGALAGPALAPFAAAGHRVASPHATFRMFEPRTSLCGRAGDIAAHAAAIRQQVDHLNALLARATGQPAERIASDMEKGLLLSGDEAREYGLVHEITAVGPRRE